MVERVGAVNAHFVSHLYNKLGEWLCVDDQRQVLRVSPKFPENLSGIMHIVLRKI